MIGTVVAGEPDAAGENRIEHKEIPPEQDELHLEPGVTFQSEADALAMDISIVAEQTGLPLETVEKAMAAQKAFGEVADQLIAAYPNAISAVWMEPMPGLQGHIKFVGNVPGRIVRQLARNGHSDLVILSGNGLISMADHVIRAETAAEALLDLGYNNSLTYYDPTNDVIQVEIQQPAGLRQPTKQEVVAAIQNRLSATGLLSNAAQIDETDVNLTLVDSAEPIITWQHSRGGNWLRDDGFRECTSGWSVSGPSGDGIITAGHCNGLNQFEEPGVPLYGMTFRSQVFGATGDVEYHTTTHPELDDFYSTATYIRDVTGIKTTSTMLGGTVCVYGRSSNVRNCNHVVQALNVTVNYPGGTVKKLARATNVSTIGGDSGGGWSWNNTAWGVHSGVSGTSWSYFTPAQQAQTALGVTIKR